MEIGLIAFVVAGAVGVGFCLGRIAKIADLWRTYQDHLDLLRSEIDSLEATIRDKSAEIEDKDLIIAGYKDVSAEQMTLVREMQARLAAREMPELHPDDLFAPKSVTTHAEHEPASFGWSPDRCKVRALAKQFGESVDLCSPQDHASPAPVHVGFDAPEDEQDRYRAFVQHTGSFDKFARPTGGG